MLQSPVPWVALTVSSPASAGRLMPASIAAVAMPPAPQRQRKSRRPSDDA